MAVLKRRLLFRRALLALSLAAVAVCAQAARLSEISEFTGVRDNILVGYGLVVGLDGSGDMTTQVPFSGQSLSNMLNQLGITLPQGGNMQLRNVAAVMVTATLPPFARAGQRLDVVVSSVGNAKSLRGGTLLMTPLKGPNGQTCALAQGNVLVAGAGAESAGSSARINQLASGRIAGGAIVEQEVPLELAREDGSLELELKRADFDLARRTVDAINLEFGAPVASALNGRVIRLQAPRHSNELVNFMARVEQVEVAPGAPDAKVVVNSRTGSVVLNERVTLRKAAVAHGNLSITIDTDLAVSQPPPFSSGETVVIGESDIEIEQQQASLHTVDGVDLEEVVDALNALGATPQDLMAILEALKAAGALQAELEIL